MILNLKTMRSLTVILLLLSPVFLVSQDWFETNDKWVFSYFAPFNDYGTVNISVQGDTTIQGIEAIVLLNERTVDNNIEQKTHIVYEESQQVYILNEKNEFELLFDFSLEIGDSIKYSPPIKDFELCNDSITYTLDSISTVSFGNTFLEVQNFSFYDPFWEYSGTRQIIEKIGPAIGDFSIKSLHYCAFDLPGSNLCTFSDGIDTLQSGNSSCERLTINTQDISSSQLTLYPNPTDGIINIDSQQSVEYYRIHTTSGSSGLINYNGQFLDLSNYVSGLYYIETIDDDSNREVFQVMKI